MFSTGDAKMYACNTPALNLTTTNVGGAINASAQLTNASVGEVHFAVTPNPISGTIDAHNKIFIKNTNGTDSAFACLIWIDNSLDDPPALQTISAVSTSASDNTGYKLRISGFASGSPLQVDLTMNGTTPVTTVSQFDLITSVEFMTTGNVLSNPVGEITISSTSGPTVLGKLPAGIPTAQSIISIGIESVIDGTTTIADTTTAPGPTLSRPRSVGTSLGFANSGTLPAGSAQGIWSRLRLPAQTKTVTSDTVSLAFQANTA